MKSIVFLFILTNLFNFGYGFNDQFVHDRFGLKEYILGLSNVDISSKCDNKTTKLCIFKCCPEGQIFQRFKSCAPSKYGFSNVTVYSNQLIGTNKSLESVFNLVPGLMKDDTFTRNALWWYKNVYLTEDGKLQMKFPNVYNRWKTIETNHFCVEMKMNKTGIRPVFMVEYPIQQFRKPSTFYKWALIVSTMFVFATLLVYALLPQLRDMNGILLMIHLLCLIVTMIAHACLESYHTMKLRMSGILTITFIFYFCKLTSLCWINVIFYRLLKSREPKAPPVSICKEVTKYSAYAIGLPFFLTSAVATIEVSDMTDMPSFVTPQIKERGNFGFHEIESLYYFFIPILVVLAFNWFVCFIKVIEFCKTSRKFAMVSTGNGGNDDESAFNRPIQFVKLLTLHTVSVLLAFFTLLSPKHSFNISAGYSILIGPAITLIFVWNKNILSMLKQLGSKWKTSDNLAMMQMKE